MSLIKCSECGREISDKAPQCIHCGCPIESQVNVESASSNESNLDMVDKTNNLDNQMLLVNRESVGENKYDEDLREFEQSLSENEDTELNIDEESIDLSEEELDEIEEYRLRRKKFGIGFLVFLVTLGIAVFFFYKYGVEEDDNDIDDVVCIENKNEDVYAIKIKATSENRNDGNIFSQKSTSPKYFVKESEVGDIYLVNYRINYTNTDECDGGIYWYSVTINEIEQFICSWGDSYVMELTKEQYDAEMAPKEPEVSVQQPTPVTPVVPQTPSTNSNNNSSNNNNNSNNSSSSSNSDNSSSSSNSNTESSVPKVEEEKEEELPPAKITSVTWEGATFNYKGTICTLDSFNASLSRPLRNDPETLRLDMDYKTTMTQNLKGWDWCEFDAKIYDSSGVLIGSHSLAVKVGLNEQGYEKNWKHLYSSDTNFSIKVVPRQ